MRRIVVGAILGLVLPAVASAAILHVAGERAQHAYLHVERVSEPLREGLTLAAADLTLFPAELQHALVVAMRDGAADVPITASVQTAWGHLSRGSARIMLEVEGVVLVVETRAEEDWFARGWSGVRRGTVAIAEELRARIETLA